MVTEEMPFREGVRGWAAGGWDINSAASVVEVGTKRQGRCLARDCTWRSWSRSWRLCELQSGAAVEHQRFETGGPRQPAHAVQNFWHSVRNRTGEDRSLTALPLPVIRGSGHRHPALWTHASCEPSRPEGRDETSCRVLVWQATRQSAQRRFRSLKKQGAARVAGPTRSGLCMCRRSLCRRPLSEQGL
mgnify:CR=1 FL=1